MRSFELHTADGNDYRLVFATGHLRDRGREAMKEAMWSVDPLEGTRYISHTETGQEVLFQHAVDTKPLLRELHAQFRSRWFTMPQAVAVVLRTDFLVSGHLKTKTLKPAEQEGVIEVQRPPGRRAGTFTDDVKIRVVKSP